MFDYSDIYWMCTENDLLENHQGWTMRTHSELRGVEQVCHKLRCNPETQDEEV